MSPRGDMLLAAVKGLLLMLGGVAALLVANTLIHNNVGDVEVRNSLTILSLVVCGGVIVWGWFVFRRS